MSEQPDYLNYLKGRSVAGLFYRKFWLYPKLAKHLSGRVLDVGCGIGDFLAFRPGTVGVDINAQIVDWCRQQGLDARIMEVDRLPFDNESFDGVILDNVLEHLSEPTNLIGEIRRVLVPGGVIVIGVPGERGYARDPDHKVFYDEQGLERVMKAGHFTRRSRFYMPIRSDWLARHMSQYCLYGVFERD